MSICAVATLGACGLPRGAALQSEILAQADAEYPDIAVYPVTRAFLPLLARWPDTSDGATHGWPGRGRSSGDIRIKPFDLIDLTVWDSEENSLLTSPGQKLVEIKALRVTERGQIFVPYLGYLRVADRTPDAARQILEQEMTAIVPSAQVQLSVVPGTRGSVSLVGGVQNPGTVALPDGDFSVLRLISQGGGPTNLRNAQVRLIRGARTYLTSYQSLLEHPERDTVLIGGDKVALVEDARYFRALGASGKEQLVYFTEDGVTALDAMSMIGGLDETRANPKGVLVLREYPPGAVRFDDEGPNNTRVVFTFDLTTSDGLFSAGKFGIEPRDTVLVTESPLKVAASAVSLITGIASVRRVAN